MYKRPGDPLDNKHTIASPASPSEAEPEGLEGMLTCELEEEPVLDPDSDTSCSGMG